MTQTRRVDPETLRQPQSSVVASTSKPRNYHALKLLSDTERTMKRDQVNLPLVLQRKLSRGPVPGSDGRLVRAPEVQTSGEVANVKGSVGAQAVQRDRFPPHSTVIDKGRTKCGCTFHRLVIAGTRMPLLGPFHQPCNPTARGVPHGVRQMTPVARFTP